MCSKTAERANPTAFAYYELALLIPSPAEKFRKLEYFVEAAEESKFAQAGRSAARVPNRRSTSKFNA